MFNIDHHLNMYQSNSVNDAVNDVISWNIPVDNVGAIYMTNNHTTSQRIKHVETRYSFVRKYVKVGILKVVFVTSEDNDVVCPCRVMVMWF